MTHDQWLNIISALLPTILSLIFGLKWWKEKTGKTGAVIEAAATAAVNALNRTMVDSDRANPNTGLGVGKVSPEVAKRAKSAAILDAAQGVIGAINPTAGEIAAKIAPALEVAIEKAVEAAKPKVPAAIVEMFPGETKTEKESEK